MYFSVLYIYIGTWIYISTVENKNTDIDGWHRRVEQLERYTKWLESKLEEQNKSQ